MLSFHLLWKIIHFVLSSICLWFLGEHVTSRFKNEVERMGFDMNNAWRISNINEKYKWVVFDPCGLCFMATAFARNPNSHVAGHLNLDFFFEMEFYLLNLNASSSAYFLSLLFPLLSLEWKEILTYSRILEPSFLSPPILPGTCMSR